MAVATPCLKFPQSPTTNDAVLNFRSTFLQTTSSNKLYRTRSCEFHPKLRNFSSSSSSIPCIRRVCSASFDNFSSYSSPYSSNYEEGEEFSKRMEELAFKFQDSDEDDFTSNLIVEKDSDSIEIESQQLQSSLLEIQSIEMKAKSLELPLSLRMIKRKKKQCQWQESFIEVGENAYCSVKKAFSSMVFIIQELHSYTLQMREILFYEDLQGILSRVQSEMHASFVWLFQQVFSHTPTLMVYVMILLANFTVHSISDSSAAAIAAVTPPVATVEEREFSGDWETFSKFDAASTIKTFTVTSSGSKTTSIGGNDGGGNKVRPVGSGMDGDDNGGSVLHRSIVSDGISSVREDTWQKEEKETKVWKEIVEEASRMKNEVRDESLVDDEILKGFVSPVSVEIDGDGVNYEDYLKTELNYQSGLAQEPNNVLLLANYAQFLYLVLHDFDRAEEYFKRAIKVEPKDAEAHNKYANFLWQVRNDLWAAEETFLEAISADPSNSYYAANYAHFLWNTGGEDTCYPLDNSPDNETLDS